MTNYRVRHSDMLYGTRRPPPSLGIIALFAAIGFIAMFGVLGSLTDRFNPGSKLSPASAQAGSTTAPGHPRP